MSSHWIKSPIENLYRHAESGRYYVRLSVQGKDTWRSLKTTSYAVAKARKVEHVQSLRRSTRNAAVDANATVGDAIQLYRAKVGSTVGLKETSKVYRYATIDAIIRSWPELEKMHLRDVTASACREWAHAFSQNYSPSRYNNSLDSFRHILQFGVDSGLIFRNPAEGIGKKTPQPKELVLPSNEQFRQVVAEMRSAEGAVSQGCADLVEFMTFTGARVGEAKLVKWSDIEPHRIRILGEKSRGAGAKIRYVPMTPATRRLLDDIKKTPRYFRSDPRRDRDYVVSVSECQQAITSACDRAGVTRFTHHDCRHMFTTRCIESGVDIPTVARWLGHVDGGALLMRTYGHLRDEHSLAMASKLNF